MLLNCGVGEDSFFLKKYKFIYFNQKGGNNDPVCETAKEKTLESPLDCKEIQPVHSKGDQFWVFFGRTDAKAETPVLWPLLEKS